MSVFKPVYLLNNINRKKEGSYSVCYYLYTKTIRVKGDALVHPGLQGSCGDLVFLAVREKRRPINHTTTHYSI